MFENNQKMTKYHEKRVNLFCSIKSDTGWSIVYIEGSQVIIFKNIIFLSLNNDFVLANSVAI